MTCGAFTSIGSSLAVLDAVLPVEAGGVQGVCVSYAERVMLLSGRVIADA